MTLTWKKKDGYQHKFIIELPVEWRKQINQLRLPSLSSPYMLAAPPAWVHNYSTFQNSTSGGLGISFLWGQCLQNQALGQV